MKTLEVCKTISWEIVVHIYHTCILSSRGRLSTVGDLTLSPEEAHTRSKNAEIYKLVQPF